MASLDGGVARGTRTRTGSPRDYDNAPLPLSSARVPVREAVLFRRAEVLELHRRETDCTFEDPPEVALVAESDLGCDSCDGPVSGAEQHSCAVDAQPMDMAGGCLVEGLSKGAPKVIPIERKRVGDPGGAQIRVGQVVGDECCCSPCSLGRGRLASGRRWLEKDFGQYELQVAVS